MKKAPVQLRLRLHDELLVDNFAGGGGASSAIEQVFGRQVDIAINHDPEAIAMHEANHPHTRHYCQDVFAIDPLEATGGKSVALAWFSPDCKHFSKAKGGKPRSKKIRDLAWVVIKWARLPEKNRPKIIMLENVEEFRDWGPLLADGSQCPLRKGETFIKWRGQLEKLGYTVDCRLLRASDYGAPTIRKRLFLVARYDGQPIVWPAPTHGDPKTAAVKNGELLPWRTAAECIDWSIPVPSIFERKKPLADATCRRIAKGIMRYVVESGSPFIVQYHSAKRDGDDRVAALGAPLPTQTTENRFALAVPTLVNTANSKTTGRGPNVWDINEPVRTVTAAPGFTLVSAFLAKHYTGVVGSELAAPLATVTSVDHHSLVTATMVTIDNQSSVSGQGPVTAPLKTTVTENRHALVTANMVHMGHGEQSNTGAKRWSHGVRDVLDPLNTITASGAPGALVTSNLIKLRGTNVGSATDEPLHTISAQGTHHAEVRAFLIKYYGKEKDGVSLADPMPTQPTRDHMGLVTVRGEDYVIVDIGLRMLSPRELFRAQGFPDSYIIDLDINGRKLPKSAQVRMCGNSVSPPPAMALIRANVGELAKEAAA